MDARPTVRPETAARAGDAPDPLPHIAEALRGLLFGTVTVVVQDGVVVQVERTEKRRLTRVPRPRG